MFPNHTFVISRPDVGQGPAQTVFWRCLVTDISFVSMFWILDFVFAIASTPYHFLYLNNEYMI